METSEHLSEENQKRLKAQRAIARLGELEVELHGLIPSSDHGLVSAPLYQVKQAIDKYTPPENAHRS